MIPVSARSCTRPATDERAAREGVGAGADAVVLDLEDAVAPARKERARALVAAESTGGRRATRPVLCASNGLDARGLCSDDVAAVARARARGGSGCRRRAAGDVAGRRAGRVGAAGLAHVRLDAVGRDGARASCARSRSRRADPRVGALCASAPPTLPSTSLRSDARRRGSSFHARSRLVLAARAAGLARRSTAVYPWLATIGGARGARARGAPLGFGGKSAIHPRQLPADQRGVRADGGGGRAAGSARRARRRGAPRAGGRCRLDRRTASSTRRWSERARARLALAGGGPRRDRRSVESRRLRARRTISRSRSHRHAASRPTTRATGMALHAAGTATCVRAGRRLGRRNELHRRCGGHIGTHVDALAHVSQRRRAARRRRRGRGAARRPFTQHGIDDGGAVRLPRRAPRRRRPRGVDVLGPGEPITADDLAGGEREGVEVRRASDAVLVRTGWARHWTDPERFVGLEQARPAPTSPARALARASAGVAARPAPTPSPTSRSPPGQGHRAAARPPDPARRARDPHRRDARSWSAGGGRRPRVRVRPRAAEDRRRDGLAGPAARRRASR